MYFYLTGIDYKSAPMEAREEIYRRRKAISGFWSSAAAAGSAVLVTCNRVEIYGAAENADEAFGLMRGFTERFPLFSRYACVRYGEERVFRHALRLASGLESQLKGEKEIFAQLDKWTENIRVKRLKGLWAGAVALSAKIRAASGLGDEGVNIATLVLGETDKRFADKRGYEAVVVGTGRIAELFAKHRPRGLRLKFVAHKNYPRARELAGHSGGEALLLEELPRALAGADVLIGATSSPHHVVRQVHFEGWERRIGRPLYIYDLAVPRDVEPQVSGIGGVFLQNLDDLDRIFRGHNASLREKIEWASRLVDAMVEDRREAANAAHA